VLGIGAFPVNWPIGNGSNFKGVYDRQAKTMHLFERTWWRQIPRAGGGGRLHDPAVRGKAGRRGPFKTVEELEMLEMARARIRRGGGAGGKTTPVFFGSGINNFGVQLLLDALLKYSPPPKPRVMAGVEVAPEDPQFSGSSSKSRRTWIRGTGIASRLSAFVRGNSSGT
jgi:peptide chain release factor 3